MTEVPKTKRPERPQLKTRQALIKVIALKKYVAQPNYKAIAIQYGIAPGSLRAAYYKWTKGLITLETDDSPEQAQVDYQAELYRTQILMAKVERLTNDLIEAEVARVEDAASRGNREQIFENLPRLLDLNSKAGKNRREKEHGLVELVKQINEVKNPGEKQIPGKTRDVDATITRETDVEKAMRAFKETDETKEGYSET